MSSLTCLFVTWVDMFIPARRFLDFCKLYEQDFGFYPLWIFNGTFPNLYAKLGNTG